MTGRRSQFDCDRPVAGLCEPGALPSSALRRPRGFTLIELLITVSIIAIMASMMLMALYGAGEAAKVAKTRAMIAKIDAIIKARWESYQTRRIPGNFPRDEWVDVNNDGLCTAGDFIDSNMDGIPNPGEAGFTDLNGNGTAQPGEYVDHNGNNTPDPGEVIDGNGNGTADPGEYTDYNNNGTPDVYLNRNYLKLCALRDLMRMELPDRWSDVVDPPAVFTNFPIARPAVSQGYLRRYNSLATPPTGVHASAECLYLIVMASVPDDAESRDVFKGADIGDVDGDGAPELVDAWGQPIKFLRWPTGFQFSELQIVGRGPASGAGPVTITSPSLPPVLNSFVGGAVITMKPSQVAMGMQPAQPGMLDPAFIARISGYTYASPAATIAVPSSPPPPTFTGEAVIMNPDPFNPGLAKRAPTDAPSFAVYPLVYSAGPDKCYSILTDFGAVTGVLRYSVGPVFLNPAWSDTDPTTGLTCFLGTARNDPNEKNYVPSAWQDNIHNHLIGTR